MSQPHPSARVRLRLARALGVVCVAASLLAPGALAAGRPAQAPTFAELLRSAPLVVHGQVIALGDDQEGRFRTAQVRVEGVLKNELKRKPGQLETLHIVEERRFVSVPPTLRSKGAVLAFLAKAPESSSRRKALEAQDYQRPIKGRWGWLGFTSAAEAKEVRGAVERWLALERREDRDSLEWTAEYRSLVFAETASRRTRLAEDGIHGLAAVPKLSETLTASERKTLARTLRRTDLPRHARLALIDLVVREQLRSLADALQDLPGRDSEISTAAWKAQRALGVELTPKELGQALRHPDPGVRAAASEEVVASRAEDCFEEGKRLAPGVAKRADDCFEEVERLAREDSERSVRIAAIRALGGSRRPSTLAVLQETMSDPDPEVRNTTARSIVEIGGSEAAITMDQVVRTAPEDIQIQAVMTMLAMGVPRDGPLMTEIRENHPNPLVRELIERGIVPHHDE